jgi:branched-chain amino acid transport system substrate-binding protein
MSLLRKWGKWIAFSIGILLFSVVPGSAEDPITVVQLEPLSGPFKEMGDLAVAGVKFAIEEINETGGVLGRKINHLVEDSQLNPDAAAQKVSKAILTDGAQLILQHTSAAVARALMNVAQKRKVIFLNFGAEADSLTGNDFNPYFFRACLTTAGRSRAYAEFFKTKPWKKFYLISMDYAFGQAMAEGFKQALKKEIPGFTVVGEDRHPLGTKDFSPYVTRILASGAEVVFTGSWGRDLEEFMKQSAERGVKARYATYFLDDPLSLPGVGQAAVGSFVNSSYLPTVPTPKNRDFLDRWHKQYRDTKNPWPTSNIGTGYNATMFLFAALKKSQTCEAEAVIKAWEGMAYDGLTGKQMMRACDHQILQPALIAEIQEKSTLFSFPFPGAPVIVPLDRVAVPLKETGNSRCK